MIDPLQRLKTLAALDAQRKADVAAIDGENRANAKEAFRPVAEAFQQLMGAGVRANQTRWK